MVTTSPLSIFQRGGLVPQCNGVSTTCTCRSVAVHVVPRSILQCHSEDVRNRVIQGLTASRGVILLRVVCSRADDVVSVVRGVDDHRLHVLGVSCLRVLVVELTSKVNQGLCLIFSRVFFGVRVEDATLGLALFRKWHFICCGESVEHPRNNSVFTFIDGRGAGLAAHRAVDSLHRHLSSECRCVCLP